MFIPHTQNYANHCFHYFYFSKVEKRFVETLVSNKETTYYLQV